MRFAFFLARGKSIHPEKRKPWRISFIDLTSTNTNVELRVARELRVWLWILLNNGLISVLVSESPQLPRAVSGRRSSAFSCGARNRQGSISCKRSKSSTYRWSTCHWSFSGITSRRAIAPKRFRPRRSFWTTRRNSAARSGESQPRSLGPARLWWRYRILADAIGTDAYSSSWGPAKDIACRWAYIVSCKRVTIVTLER